MLTVRIIYIDSNRESDIKEVWNLDELCLDGVESFRVIRIG